MIDFIKNDYVKAIEESLEGMDRVANIDTIFEFGESHKSSSGFGLYYFKMFVEGNKGILNISSPGKRKGCNCKCDV